jgi:hypothetical protein
MIPVLQSRDDLVEILKEWDTNKVKYIPISTWDVSTIGF